jgi:hypothetical protein
LALEKMEKMDLRSSFTYSFTITYKFRQVKGREG